MRRAITKGSHVPARDFKLDLALLEQLLVFPGLGIVSPNLPVPMETLEPLGCLNEGELGCSCSSGLRAAWAAWEAEEGRARQRLRLGGQ